MDEPAILNEESGLSQIVPLNIPSRVLPSLEALADLSDEQADELLTAMAQTAPRVAAHTLSVTLDSPLPHLDIDNSELLLTALFNIWAVSDSHNWDLADVVESAAQYTELNISADSRKIFGKRFYRALSIGKLSTLARAVDVATEFDALYHTARCFTDIRPVFSRSPHEPVQGAVIIHNLRLDYFTPEESRSVTITLADEDVQNLIDVLTAARERSTKVHNFLQSTTAQHFQISRQSED